MHPDAVRAAIEESAETVGLATVMWANNEVGTVQDVAAMAAIAHEHGIAFHTDAVQATGHLPVDFAASGVDLMSVSAHKLGGPIGIGALVAKRDARLVALSHGGGQERGVRSGTLDVASIRAFAVAVTDAVDRREAEAARIGALRDRFLSRHPGARPRHPGHRLLGGR